ncbi:DUF3046 domain-containing protein [Demequina sp.]|uniref:DUF3046 domain-containing protein n=1 Tax=Demequina sp. TaxID=2050685 RepID=UPI003D0E4A4B
MRVSEFWELAAEVFGDTYAPTLGRELSLTALGSLTPAAALDAGVPARDVWHAWCDEMQIPAGVRDGSNPHRTVPRRR